MMQPSASFTNSTRVDSRDFIPYSPTRAAPPNAAAGTNRVPHISVRAVRVVARSGPGFHASPRRCTPASFPRHAHLNQTRHPIPAVKLATHRTKESTMEESKTRRAGAKKRNAQEACVDMLTGASVALRPHPPAMYCSSIKVYKGAHIYLGCSQVLPTPPPQRRRRRGGADSRSPALPFHGVPRGRRRESKPCQSSTSTRSSSKRRSNKCPSSSSSSQCCRRSLRAKSPV